tara:strand:+ start:847 stop:1089 length:243 start_codon:yes stop_codon:yes gene_type:complete
MNRGFVRRNVTGFSILLFIILYMLIQFTKPIVLFEPNGGLRSFGVGSTKKTVLPMWLVAIILAILSYLAVLFYLTYPKLR